MMETPPKMNEQSTGRQLHALWTAADDDAEYKRQFPNGHLRLHALENFRSPLKLLGPTQ